MGWTDISASRKDADSPIDEDLIGDMDANSIYNFDHAVRSGTHATGVRTAMARGTQGFSGSSWASLSVLVNFNTSHEDGQPNFLAAPIVAISLEEIDAGDNWDNYNIASYIEHGTLTATQCYVKVRFTDDTGEVSKDWEGKVHWIAIGLVVSGE